MSVLTDLIIADKNEAETVAASIAPLEQWQGVDAKGQSQITLGTLLCILRGESYDETVLDAFPLLAQEAEDGAWVFAVPDELVSGLHQLDDAQTSTIISEWRKSEEMQDVNYDVESFFRELKSLATEAVSQRKPILMWVSL